MKHTVTQHFGPNIELSNLQLRVLPLPWDLDAHF